VLYENYVLVASIVSIAKKCCILLIVLLLVLTLPPHSDQVKAEVIFDGATDYNGDGYADMTIHNGQVRVSFLTEERLDNPPGQQIAYLPYFYRWDVNDWQLIAAMTHPFQIAIAPDTSELPNASYSIRERYPQRVGSSWEQFYQECVTITDSNGHQWQVTDYYTLQDGWDYIEIERRWQHLDASPEQGVLLPFNLSIVYPPAVSPRRADSLMMPGYFYSGNEYQLNHDGREVSPDFPMADLSNASQYLIVEQDRLTVPSIIWEYDTFVCGLLTTPSYEYNGTAVTGNCSLGYRGDADRFDLTSYLGGWTSGGSQREGYSYARHIHDQVGQDNPGCCDQYEWTFSNTSLTVDANVELRKTYRLYLGMITTPYYGFIEPIQLGWDWINTGYSEVTPSLTMQEILQLKAELAYRTYYHTNQTENEYLFLAGFFSDDSTPVTFMGGSTASMGGQLGQQHALAYALLYYGYQTGNSSMITAATQTIDAFVDLTRNPSAVTLDDYGWLQPDYYLETNTSYANARDHGGDVHTVKSGEVLYNLLQCYLLTAQYGDNHPQWLAYIEQAINIFVVKQFANGTFGNTWTNGPSSSCNDIAGSGGVTLALTLIELSNLTGNTTYSDAGTLAMNYYITEFVDKARFFGADTGRYQLSYGYKKHITDSKTAEYMLKTLLRFYELTDDPTYLNKAHLTGQWLLTWQYAWNVPLTANSRLEAQNFQTKGSIASSVELNAIRPAYGTSYALEKLATYLSDAELHHRAELVGHASTQMTATPSDPLGMSSALVGAQETYWYHASFSEDSNTPNGGSSGLCYGITIAEAYLGTNVSLANGGDDSDNGGDDPGDGDGSNGGDDGGGGSDGDGDGDTSTEATPLIVTVTLENDTQLRANTNKEIYVTVTDDQGTPIEQAQVTITLNTNYTLNCEEVEPGSYKAVLDTSQVAVGEYLVIITVEKTGYRTTEHHYTLTVTPGLNLAAVSFSARIGAISGIGIILTIIGKRKLFDDITLEL
jgi:hypothetical protein